MAELSEPEARRLLERYEAAGSIRGLTREFGWSYDKANRLIGAAQRVLRGEDQPEAKPTPAAADFSDLEAVVRRMLAEIGGAPAGGKTEIIVEKSLDEFPALQAGGLVHAEKPYCRVGWLSDLHFPYQDQPAIDAAMEYLREWGPDLIILGGDLWDFYGISRFDKDPEREIRLQEEFDSARDFIAAVDALGADVVYLLGNHEERFMNLIRSNPGLSRMRAMEFPRAAELPRRWLVYPSQTHYRLSHLTFLHGDLKGRGGSAKHIACNMLGKLKTSILFGHYHRGQWHPEPGYDKTVRAGFAIGHLCDEAKADYIRCPEWVSGFASIDFDHEAGVFDVRQHIIIGGKFRFNGKTYG